MTDLTQVENITIVGGGSAGWITACLLDSYLNTAACRKVDITLVESPNIPTVGVGEATVPTIRDTLVKIGIGEAEFMKATDATFKSLIRFRDWNLGDVFDHPFDRRQRPDTDDVVLDWLREPNNTGESFAKNFSLLSNTCDRNLSPKGLGWPDYQSPFPYAYHLDAVKLSNYLAKIGMSRGVKRVLKDVVDVKLNETGRIDRIITEDGEQLVADLYVDCTGFAARLAKHTSPGTRDYSDQLLCDRAVTLHVPFTTFQPENIRPYTEATALEAGWVWDINLQNRRGVGYVYSSKHSSEEQAERAVRAYEGDHAAGIDLRHIKFKTYKREQSWVGNCVSIGLSDGFIEPLESSGLFMIEYFAHTLGKTLEASPQYTSSTARHFNRISTSLYDEVVDFVSLHYLTSKRTDTSFWTDASDPARASDTIRDLLADWTHRPLTETDVLNRNRMFSHESLEFLIYGMSHTHLPASKPMAPPHNIEKALQNCFDRLPLHEDWLSQSLK